MDESIILFLGDAEKNPISLAKRLLTHCNCEDVNHQDETNGNVLYFPLKIDTKYYSANIKICCLGTPTTDKLTNTELRESTKGVVFYFDGKKDDCLAGAEAWLPYVELLRCGVKLLVCDECSESVYEKVIKWGLKHGYEFIDLSEEPTEEDDVVGMKRIKNALDAGKWKGMTLKNEENETPNNEEKKKKFEADFQSLCNLKETRDYLMTLPFEQRKIEAEKVILTQFKGLLDESDDSDDSE